ncbi:MAG: DNA topoisomerase, partial [Muribaculum sp.]|nr:DNA topoisomerase [Muribaculum sp.]
MITIIAQSARIARTISYALAADLEFNGYYANEKYYITWTYGHMVELTAPGIGRDFWLSNQSFPILPESFPLTHSPSQHASGRYMPDPQLAVIKHLLEKSKKVILATDPTDRGDLMAGYLVRFFNFEGKVYRVALSDLMFDTIKNAIVYPSESIKTYEENLRYMEQYDRMDWLTNLNINRAIAFSVGRNTYPVSRTSLPILHLVAEREKAIREFTPTKSVVPTITVKDNDGEVHSFLCTEEWSDIPQEFSESVKAGNTVEVIGIETETVDTRAPKLLNLQMLQRFASMRFGMDPLETYRIARGLYEKKRISFPGSSREGITRRDFDEFKKKTFPAMCEAKSFKALMGDNYTPYFTHSAKSLYNRPHGIILTAYPFIGLSDDEKKIMFLVGLGMLATFQRNYRSEITLVTLSCGDYTFTATYRKVVRSGWKKVFGGKIESSRRAPNIEIGQQLAIESIGSVGKTTQMPKAMDD